MHLLISLGLQIKSSIRSAKPLTATLKNLLETFVGSPFMRKFVIEVYKIKQSMKKELLLPVPERTVEH